MDTTTQQQNCALNQAHEHLKSHHAVALAGKNGLLVNGSSRTRQPRKQLQRRQPRSLCLIFMSPSLHAAHTLLNMPRVTVDALMGETRLLAKEQQDKVLALFRRGHSNTLFTTSVAEEGLDVQHCSLVICYDVPKRPLSLVQTVGRARARNARVIFMEEEGADGSMQTVRSRYAQLKHLRGVSRRFLSPCSGVQLFGLLSARQVVYAPVKSSSWRWKRAQSCA